MLMVDEASLASTRMVSELWQKLQPGDRVLLEEALKDKSWLVRAAAAQALGHAGDQSDIEKLMPMMDDSHPAVRYKAAAAIVRLTTTVSTPSGQ